MKDRSHIPHEKTVFTNQHGAVRVYVLRHINGCLSTDPNERWCPCPKHIYFKPRNGKDGRVSAKTPSHAEACEQAQKILRGFDPEIAELRAQKSQADPAGISVEAALGKYMAAVRSRNVTEDYIDRNLAVVFRRRGQRRTRPAVN